MTIKMEFNVKDKSTRKLATVLVILSWILWIALIVIYLVSTQMNIGVGAIILFVIVSLLLIVSTLLSALDEYATVVIDENGVCLRCGKLVFKKFTWDEVKRIEKVRVKSGTIINVLTCASASHSFNSNYYFDNIFSKSRITLMYDDKVISQIRKYFYKYIYEN